MLLFLVIVEDDKKIIMIISSILIMFIMIFCYLKGSRILLNYQIVIELVEIFEILIIMSGNMLLFYATVINCYRFFEFFADSSYMFKILYNDP